MVTRGGAESSFLFLPVSLPLALYIRRTYPEVAPYPLRTTLLAFPDDMAVVTATTPQPVPDDPDDTRASQVLQDLTIYLENNRLLVHNIKSDTMAHNAPPLPLRPGDPALTPMGTATNLGIQQAALPEDITLPPNLGCQLTRTVFIARIAALSTRALAYFFQAMLNVAIGFQALHLMQPKHMPKGAATTVRGVWAIHGHRPTSLPADLPVGSGPYYSDGTNHLVHNAYTAHTAAHLLMQNQEPEVRKVFTLTHGKPNTNETGVHTSTYQNPSTYSTNRASRPGWEPKYGATCNSCYRTTEVSIKGTTGPKRRAS